MTQHEIYWHAEDFRYRFHKNTYDCPLHIHQHIELVYVFDGSIDLTIDNQKYTLQKNNAALIFPWQLHSYSSSENSNIFICVFAEKFIPEFYSIVKKNTVLNNTFIFDKSTLTIINKLYNEKHIITYCIKSLLYNATHDFLCQVSLVEKKNDSEITDKIISFVSKNLSSELDLAFTAQELGYSRNYLSHIIKRTIGINFRTLVNCMKFEQAKDHLLNSSRSITEIAHLSGFGTERSFNRTFKALSGITPKEYREKLK